MSMKVQIESPGPLDVESFEAIPSGGITSVPFFYDSGKEGCAGVVRVFGSDGKLLQAARLVVDGATGKLKLQDRSAPTKPRIEQEQETPPASTPPPGSHSGSGAPPPGSHTGGHGKGTGH